MKFARQMLNHTEKQQILLLKTYQFTTPFKDDIWQVPDIKPQISQKMITSQHSDILAMCCEVMSSFVIFAVLYR